MTVRATSRTRRLLLLPLTVMALVGAGAAATEAKAWAAYDTGYQCKALPGIADRVLCERNTEWYAGGFYRKYYLSDVYDCVWNETRKCYLTIRRENSWWWNGNSWQVY